MEQTQKTGVEKVNEFLDEAGVWYFLTTDGDQPKGRPFRFHLLKDGRMYFGTGTFKNVWRQMGANPQVEVLAAKGGQFMRYDGTVALDDDEAGRALAAAVLAKAPAMQKVYNDETGYELGLFHLEGGHAEIRTAMGLVEEFDL